ncbi:MAG: hypothetical protein AUG81_05650 [Verrucomicrobia bacterium 13_1_20CM_4_54_11]|nr:MAG: hypothetical protein AUG81_05650 [Verrucomicrobia bacterium 13_1_20CM_4_54_11]
MEVIHDSAFWRDLSHARPAEKDGGAEYRVEKTNSGFAVSGPALGKRSYFKTENKAMSLARHIIGPKGALSLASRRTAKQPANACQRNSDIRPPGGHQRDAELEYDPTFPLSVPDESARQALLEFIQRRDQEVAKRVTDALLKAGYHR